MPVTQTALPIVVPFVISLRMLIEAHEMNEAWNAAHAQPCADCGDPLSDDDLDNEYLNCAGEPICESCRDDYFECERCESTVHADDINTIQGVRYGSNQHDAVWCDDCTGLHAETCSGCSETFHAHDVYSNECCSESFCDSCRECDEYCDRCEVSYCDGCVCPECDGRGSSLIHDSGYKPEPIFHGTGAYHFGVELELTGPEDMADAVHELDDDESDWFAKEDGSVQGVEFVSHPRDLASWQAYSVKRFLDTVKNAGARAGHDGMHIHISRTAWKSGNHLRRTYDMIARSDDNKALAEHMAGRAENSWASFRTRERKAVARDYKGYQGGDRYNVLNLRNDHTVEFRLGQSTLSKVKFLAMVEYLHACVEWTRNVNLETEAFGALTPDALFHYMCDNAATYSNALQVMMPFMANAYGNGDYPGSVEDNA